MGDRDKLGDRDRRLGEGAPLGDGVLYTVGGAARYLGVSETTIRNWERDGYLLCMRTDTGVRIFTQSELDRGKRTIDARSK